MEKEDGKEDGKRMLKNKKENRRRKQMMKKRRWNHKSPVDTFRRNVSDIFTKNTDKKTFLKHVKTICGEE